MAFELSRGNQVGVSIRGSLCAFAVVALLLLAVPAGAGASPGDLDPTFSGDGLASAAFEDESRASAVAVQPSGRIVVAGGRKDFDLAVFNANGTPDTEFSGDGRQTTDFGYEEERANAVVVQPNGKIVVAGEAGPFFALARYNADGTLDESFGGGDGKVLTDFPETDFDAANAVVVQPNGKIVAAGMAWPDTDSPQSIALARYEGDGSLDEGFGEDEDGLVVTSFPESEGDVANAILLRPSGKLVAVGTVHDPPNGTGRGEVGLVQYGTDGTPDTGFGGGDGMASARSVTQATSAALAPNGQIAVAGGFQNFLTGRFESDGSVDTSYDGEGALFPGWHGEGRLAYAVQVQKNGRVIAAGTIHDEETGAVNYAVARYETDGSLDTSFGEDGMVTTEFEESQNGARAIALQPDGKIVIAGGAPGGFGVIRYEGDPPPPSTPEPPAKGLAPPSPTGDPGDFDRLEKHPPRKKGSHRRCGKHKAKKAKRKCGRKHHRSSHR
ncbi:MAG TPA: hypothetical protein VF245_07000 [Solirubrobacterales bacterium]